MNTVLQTALIALASAASWGGGDFCGGMGVKAAGPGVSRAVRFIVLAHAISLAALLLLLWALPQSWVPQPALSVVEWVSLLRHGSGSDAPALWAVAGGMTGALGLVAFYIALSRGAMGASAAVSGLLAAAIPSGVAMVMQGVPGALRLAGFAVALGAIWMIAAGDSPESTGESKATMGMAVFGGVAFGLYFVCLRMANPLGAVVPMAIARAGSLTLCVPVLLWMQRGAAPIAGAWTSGWQWALGVALLDTGGNSLFVAATRVGRLDVASVLAGLYPAGTILLAALYLHERPTRRQMAGIVVALVAVVMITL